MITLSEVSKRYGDTLALDSASLHVPHGAVHGVLGRSGAGKSTLLRTVNMLEPPDSGSIRVDDEEMTTLDRRELRARRAGIGMIFQHFHLLGNRTVLSNVALPLRLHGVPRAERARRAAEMLDLVGLSEHASKHPAQLSGGQRQRVAAARALAPRPKVLLSDEATSSLDPDTTSEILGLLTRLRDELDLTILLITHELDVVTRACDSATVLEAGRVAEQGAVSQLLALPDSRLGRQARRAVEALTPAREPEAVRA